MSNPDLWDGSLLKSNDPKPKKEPRARRGKRLKPVSERQGKRTAFLHGVKAERLWQQTQVPQRFGDALYEYHCEGDCGTFYGSWEEAWNELTLHHTVKRSKGHGYIDYADFGVDEPRLLILLCRSCHQAVESNPRFGKATA